MKIYNSELQQKNLLPIRIGIGLHTVRLILGTVGRFGPMDGTAIGLSVVILNVSTIIIWVKDVQQEKRIKFSITK
ncbi:hypothetical protein [Okeania sp. SIO2C9]|uniref:hypothetical protein n=1 Tax=Okeania sp. SIO2C9 TaxID=2607791 RepID=UPI0025F0909E|nr:hypothetical protein [Okeania sp. SIO2C9]